MQALEDYGRPTFLIVPHDHYRMDAPACKARCPSIEERPAETLRALANSLQ